MAITATTATATTIHAQAGMPWFVCGSTSVPGSTGAGASDTVIFTGDSLLCCWPLASSYVTFSLASYSPAASAVKANPMEPEAPDATLPMYCVACVAVMPSPSMDASTLDTSPLPLFTYSMEIVDSSPALTVAGSTGSPSSKRSGCETGTEILISEVLELRVSPSTYSYLKLISMPCAPFFALDSTCMGTVCVSE